MDASARVAKLMLVRRNSRKDLPSLGTLFSQWSTALSATDPMRRMTMGGAPPSGPAAEPTIDACTDAFCAVQLTSINSTGKQDSILLSSPRGNNLDSVPPSSPRGSFKSLATLLLSPASSLKDGVTLLSPQTSLKANLDVIPRPAIGANGDNDEAFPLHNKLESLLLSSPRGSFNNHATMLLSPAASPKEDGVTPLSPQTSLKPKFDMVPRPAFGANGDNDVLLLDCSTGLSVSSGCGAGTIQTC